MISVTIRCCVCTGLPKNLVHIDGTFEFLPYCDGCLAHSLPALREKYPRDARGMNGYIVYRLSLQPV